MRPSAPSSTGIEPDLQDVDARSEVRAAYGGFGVVIGVLLVAVPWLPQYGPGIVLTVAMSLAGMASGRVLSAAIEGLPSRTPLGVGAVEAAAALALLLTLGE